MPSPAPSGAPGQPSPAPSGGSPAPSDVQKYLTAEEGSKILERLDAQSRILAGLEKKFSAPAPEPNPAPKPEPTKPGETDPALTARIKALEQSEARGKDNLKRSSLKTAAMSGGVSETDAADFVDLVLLRHGDKVKVNDDYSVHYQESESTLTPVADWVKAMLQTQTGKRFLPPPGGAPGGDGNKGGGPPKPPASFDGLKYKDVMRDPNMLRQMQKDQPALLERLRTEADQERQAR